VDRTLLCGGSGDANLTLLGATANLSGISYNWQSGPAATGPWTNFGQDDTIVNTGTLTSSTYFRCYVSCVPSGSSDTSAVVLVTVSSNPIPVVTVSPNTNVIYCSGSAPVVLVASGSNSYVWTPDIAIPNGVGDSALAAPGVNTTYTIVGTDTTGCFASTTVNVQARISPNVNGTTNNNTICDGASTNLQASITGPGFGIQFQWNPGALTGANQTVSPSTTTSYVVSATSPQSGCVGLDTVLITVNPANVASFTYTVVNQTVTFVDASTGATSWLWDFGDGTTSTLQSPAYTYGANGVYIVSLIVDNGLCPADTFTQTIIVGPASIETLNDPTDLILFPNPASGPVTIVFLSESNRAEIFIINQLGQTVQETEATKGPENLFTVEMETSKLAKGVYQIKVITEKEERLHTFIKE
jgi:PKD repeat protein